MNKKREKILTVIKLIRDSFHESVATYTCGRCYHFSKVLQGIFGGEIYESERGSHCYTKIDGYFYDIHGDAERRYHAADFSKSKKLSKEDEFVWDSNWNSGTVSKFHETYLKED